MSNVPEPENILLLKTIANQGVLVGGYFQPAAAVSGHSRTHHIWCAAVLLDLQWLVIVIGCKSRETAAMSGRHIWYVAVPIDLQWLL